MDAIVLAAGKGERLGGRKARLMLNGAILALQHVRHLKAAGFTPIVVAHPDDEATLKTEAKVVVSLEADQAGSLSLGVHALPPDAQMVLITPVDALPASKATLDLLIAGLRDAQALAVTPTYLGHGGHPVLVRRSVLDAYDRGRPILRELLASLGDRRALVETGDPHVLSDLDDAARVFAATGEQPRFG